ncbi:MAG: NifU family protein [Planctomycetes bacterium]|nr:NifU family protein [Planctomycetota bacterium]
MGRTVKKKLYEQVASVIEALRPMAQSDGGDIELVDVDEDGIVTVRLLGACVGCPSSTMTLTMGIERNLKNQIPEVTRVICE